MISMPKTTKEGYQILIYRLIDTDPSKILFADAIKGFCMFNDIRLSEDLLAEGYIVIFDMKGVKLAHVSRVQLSPLRSFMSYIQEAHPARLKKIYICHAASFVNQIMSLVKPLIKSELMSLLHFTTKGPSDIIDKDLLPIVSFLICNACLKILSFMPISTQLAWNRRYDKYLYLFRSMKEPVALVLNFMMINEKKWKQFIKIG